MAPGHVQRRLFDQGLTASQVGESLARLLEKTQLDLGAAELGGCRGLLTHVEHVDPDDDGAPSGRIGEEGLEISGECRQGPPVHLDRPTPVEKADFRLADRRRVGSQIEHAGDRDRGLARKRGRVGEVENDRLRDPGRRGEDEEEEEPAHEVVETNPKGTR